MLLVPDGINNLQFHNISDRSVTVVWQAPEHANGILIGYSVLYMVKDQPDSLKSKNVTETVTQTTITNLMVCTVCHHENFKLKFIVLLCTMVFNYAAYYTL